MPIISNIDVNDALYNTNAPFDYTCRLSLGGEQTLPYGSFLSIKIYCDSDVTPPVRLSGITANSTSVDLVFSDSTNTKVGAAIIQYADTPTVLGADSAFISSFIRNDIGDISGHVAISPEAIGALYIAAHRTGGTFKPDYGDFVLLPQCLYPVHRPRTRVISINGITSRCNICLCPGTYVALDTEYTPYEKERTLQISLAGPPDEEKPKGSFTALKITHKDEKGTEIDTDWKTINEGPVMIRASMLSNLRVINTSAGIELKGVLDV